MLNSYVPLIDLPHEFAHNQLFGKKNIINDCFNLHALLIIIFINAIISFIFYI